MTIPYQPKVNARPVGMEQLINSEFHIVGTTGVATNSPNTIRLIEVPVHDSPSTVIIPGFTETTGSPTLTQFVVNYANGRIAFNAGQNGNTVFVTYKGRGSEVDAEDVNELQIPLGSIANMNGTLTNGIVRPSTISIDPSDNFVFPNHVTANGSLFTKHEVDWTGIAAPAVSAANHGVIYFDNTSQTFQISENGGVYQPLGFVNPGVQYQLAYYASNGRTLSGLALISPSRAVITDVNGLPVASVTTSTEIGYVSGVTSSIQTQFTGKLSRDGTLPMTGNLNMNSNFIQNLLDPLNAQDAATRHYVDSVAQGITWKQVVRLATAAILPNSPIYANGAAGVGATLTATVNGALSVDGTLVAVNDRILVKDQTTMFQNGIYDVTAAGSVGTPYILTRSADANEPSELQAGIAVFVSAGTTNVELGFIQILTVTTIGTSSIQFTQFTGAAYITTTYPLAKSGNTIYITPLGIDNSLISTTAAITYSKLAALGPYATVVTDTDGHIITGQLTSDDLYQRTFYRTITSTDSPSGNPPTFAYLIVQDLAYTAAIAGTFGNDISVAYIGDGIFGSETVNVFGKAITVHMAPGASTANGIKSKVDLSIAVVPPATSNVISPAGVNTITYEFTTTSPHGMLTGQVGSFTTTGTLPGFLVVGDYYYIITTGLSTYKLAYSAADAFSNIPIVIPTAGTGTQTFHPAQLVNVSVYGIGTNTQTASPAQFFQVAGTSGLPAPIEGSTWYNMVTHQWMGYNGTFNVILG